MTFDELISSMTPEIHGSMKTAVELGKWPDGRRLSEEERKTCLQAVIAYDQQLPEEERVGYLDRTKADGQPHSPSQSTEEIVRLLNS
jgi:hypothetical protein